MTTIKNNKEKPSFWRRLGIGKNKTSSIKSDYDKKGDLQNEYESSIKSKRRSSLFSQQQKRHSSNQLPKIPNPTGPKSTQPFTESNHQQLMKHVDAEHTKIIPIHTIDMSYKDMIPTPTADPQLLDGDTPSKQIDVTHLPMATIGTTNTDINQELSSDDVVVNQDSMATANKHIASIKHTSANSKYTPDTEDTPDNNEDTTINKHTPANQYTPMAEPIQTAVIDEDAPIKEYSPDISADIVNEKELLLLEINGLKSELDRERATVQVLQKQKEAITRDLDYFGQTVDELVNDKQELIQQLEDEKAKNQNQQEDLDLLLDKMKSTADNARDQSFAVEHSKHELEALQTRFQEDTDKLNKEIVSKDRMIRELRSQLSLYQQQTDKFQSTLDQLIETHAAEISRITAEKENSVSWSMHTPNGSPRIQSTQDTEEWIHNNDPHPVLFSTSCDSSPNSIHIVNRVKSSESNRIHKTSTASMNSFDLDDLLMKLTKEKEKLQSDYSKIPLSGGGPQSRRRKEELEAMLDQVDSQLSKVKQKIRRS
ncbi:hypothetical protein BDB01DRAFT_896145 [Pilobolus umbonatus]|nr:hypothetical protein BDB01DRAFT_896145 [Pilobolus umbonatus]